MARIRIDKQLMADIAELNRKLNAVSDSAKKEAQAAFRKAAPVLISAIQARAPESAHVHYRYKTAKLSDKMRAPNGMGTRVAEYYPGNLKRSFKTLVFRKSAAIYVGPKLDKSGSGGVFIGGRTDGYYAHWQEFGAPEAGILPQPFVKPAVSAAGEPTMIVAKQYLKEVIEKTAKR